MIHAWLKGQWDQLVARDLPHALLFAGPAGIGKRELATELSRFTLCQADLKPCGSCNSCHWFAAGTHPDFITIEPEEGKKTISVNQIRSLVSTLTQTSNACGFQVVLLTPADKMTTAAANALLKTLEEPPGPVILMLVTDRPSNLPATIISRCQRVRCTPPTLEQATHWLTEQGEDPALLTLADGMPLKAIALKDQAEFLVAQREALSSMDNPLALAAQWAKSDVPMLLNFFSSLVMQMIRTKFDHEGELKALADTWEVNRLFDFWKQVTHALGLVNSQANPNVQNLLEKLFINWSTRNATD